MTAKVPGQPDVVQNIMYLGARYKRNASLDGRFVQITDYTQGKMLTLIVHAEDPLSDVPQKQAIQIDKVPDTRTGARKKDQIELDWLQNLQRGAESVKDLGESKVDGKTAVGFAVKKQGQTNTLFADKETGFPLRLEITTDKRPSYVTILSDFVFNSQLDESLFSLDRPEGFVVQTMHGEDTPAAKWLKEHKSQADSEKQE
ncbi:MAG: DUF2092 domain-containing protein [Planctomycetes bacterium]|nr:DUF2092 domain-containing protein [Planctomycetota bacterium]